MDYDLTTDQIRVFRYILSNISKKRPLVIGINGYDASGKSEFSRRLKSWLVNKGHSTCIIHLDDFHNPLVKRREGPNENQAYIDNAFNLDLLSSILQEIRHSGYYMKKLDLLNIETDDYSISRSYNIEADEIILVGGVLLFRPPINRYIDFRIYLDVSVETLVQRNIDRAPDKDPIEVEKRYRSKYLEINNWYYESCQPNIIADLEINNENYYCPQII